MNHLTVLYDPGCNLCTRARAWLERQPKFTPLYFVPAGSEEARARFAGLRPETTLGVIHVICDEGAVYRGAGAWLICLWARERYRKWSYTLATPALLPSARRFISRSSNHRL